jgi:hypothetical protein
VSESETRSSRSITEVLAAFESDGYRAQFRVLDGGRVECLTCRQVSAASDVELARLGRLEGASDPAEMLAVAALVCPHCHTRGTVVLGYGPEATREDSEVLLALDDERVEPD